MYNLKQHIAAQGEFIEFVGDAAYFNDFIAARDPAKGFIYEQEPQEEQEEVQQEDDYDD